MPNYDLRTLIADMKKSVSTHRIVVVGDVILDRYISGAVNRVSPEAPIAVLKHQEQEDTLGGAGNVYNNLLALGAQSSLIGVQGRDREADALTAIANHSARGRYIAITDPARKTSLKVRFVSSGQQLLRLDNESTENIDLSIENLLIEAVERALQGAQALILSDYQKGVLTDSALQRLIELAHHYKKLVLVDPKREQFHAYRGADYITPNRKELAATLGSEPKTNEDFEKFGRKLITEHQFGAVLATRGESGVSLITSKQAQHLQPKARRVYDVVGAGDSFIAAFALARSFTENDELCAHFANLAASVVVAKRNTATSTLEEILDLVAQRIVRRPRSKISDLDTVLSKTQQWRHEGEIIGYTNGCFDLLHTGHIALIGQARTHCDRLIVGLNSDESVRLLKGEKRPIQPQEDRAMILAALADVDAVCIFNAATPIDMITAIRPDVLIKGKDYQEKDIVGHDLVQSYGGRIVLAELVAGRGTTRLLEKASQ